MSFFIPLFSPFFFVFISGMHFISDFLSQFSLPQNHDGKDYFKKKWSEEEGEGGGGKKKLMCGLSTIKTLSSAPSFFVAAAGAARPATVERKMEAQSETCMCCEHGFFFHVWRQFACSVGDYRQKFLHRSSGGISLLRLCCLLVGWQLQQRTQLTLWSSWAIAI